MYKARLIAKEYTQYGIDYQETFAPVAKANTIRIFFFNFFAANFDWSLHKFDVNNVFLHRDLKEEVYMDIPPRFIHKS